MSLQRSDWLGLGAALLVASPVLLGLAYSGLGALGMVGVAADGPTAALLTRALTSPSTWAGVVWSLWVAGASTLLATVVAVAVAVTFRGGSRVDGVARALTLLPLPLPHLVAGVCGVLILSQSGIASRVGFQMGLLDSPGEMPVLVSDPWGVGLILTLTWKEVPFLALVAFSVLARRGRRLEEAARTLGAEPWQTFRRITWPVLWRGILPAVVAVFTFVVGTWEVTAILAPSDPLALPLQIMERHTDVLLTRRGEAFVLVLVAMALAGAAVAAHEAVRARWDALGP